MSPLYVKDGAGAYRLAERVEILTAARAAVSLRKGASLSAPRRAVDYLLMTYGGLDYEVFGCLWLSKRHTLLKAEAMFRGTIDGAAVYPREVLKAAIACSAAAVIFHHCHPSGSTEPSQADEVITNRLKEALALIDVRVLDHMIIAGSEYLSMAERGLI